MRTIFDDLEAKINQEEEKKGGSKTLPIVLWFVALAFIVATWGVYRWVISRPALTPPPPPVSLEDVRQVAQAFAKFNRVVQDDNWMEAQNMLSMAAIQRLTSTGKTLKQSILGDRASDKVVEAASTASGDRQPGRVHQDCVYKFADGQFKIIPLALIMENGRLVIDNWEQEGVEEKPGDKKPGEKK